LSRLEASENGSRVITLVATPIERNVVTSLVPTLPAPPTTKTSSSVPGVGRPGGGAGSVSGVSSVSTPEAEAPFDASARVQTVRAKREHGCAPMVRLEK
jgi:hypothetical protein